MFEKTTVKKYLKNNGQKIFEKYRSEKYLKNNGHFFVSNLARQ